MLSIKVRGDFKNTERFLNRAKDVDIEAILNKYGAQGCMMLQAATPKDSGKTSMMWDYEIEIDGDKKAIYWTNDNINNGVPIAVILQYGHGTNNGGYVQGRDYINPAMRSIFDGIAEEAWEEVTKG